MIRSVNYGADSMMIDVEKVLIELGAVQRNDSRLKREDNDGGEALKTTNSIRQSSRTYDDDDDDDSD